MARAFDLMVIGEINPDLILQGPDIQPAFGQAEKLVEHAELVIGSSAVIVACGAARLGLKTAFIGVVGDDVFGQFMLKAMAEKGIDTQYCQVSASQPTGFSVILSQPQDRAILTYAGSISALKRSDIDLTMLKDARHLHLSSFFLLDALRPDIPGLFREAKNLGLSTSLDTNWDPGGSWDDGLFETLTYTDVFLPNQEELLRIAQEQELEPALSKLSQRVPTLAIKLGAKGGLARQGNEGARAGILPLKVVDTTGAGDSFDAGFLYAYLQGWTLEKSLQFACACGSLSTREVGGTGAQPSLEEALEALDRLQV